METKSTQTIACLSPGAKGTLGVIQPEEVERASPLILSIQKVKIQLCDIDLKEYIFVVELKEHQKGQQMQAVTFERLT